MQIRHVLRFAVATLLVLLVGMNLAAVSSAGSIPGDPLYGVKRSLEEARLTLTIRERDREQLLEQLVERRQDEVREMVQQGREGILELEGILRPLADGRWSVDGLPLVLSERAVIEGELEPGARVWIRAQVRSDGALVALRARIRNRLLPPTAAPGETPDDIPNGRPRSATPVSQRTSDPTPPPQNTRAPEPTATPRPTATPEPAETYQADQAPGPTETREPEPTPGPSRTSEPEHTPRPTKTREPDHAPEQTSTHEPEHTSEPTSTHEPEHTPEPTRTHEPEPTPVATGAPEHTAEPLDGTGEPRHTPEPGGTPGATPHRG